MASKVPNSLNGFTLIEIVVSVGISLLLLSAVIGNYNGYNDTQKLKQAALTVKNDFRFLQSKAISGEKPADPSGILTPDEFCPQLVGYQLTFSASNYRYQAQCSPAAPNAPTTTVNLPASITFTVYPSPFIVRVLSRGTSLTGTATIRLTGLSRQYTLTVSPGGDISDVGLQ